MDRTQIEILKRKFLAGQCTPQELEAMEGWLAEVPDQAAPEPLDRVTEAQLEASLWEGIGERLASDAAFVPPHRYRTWFTQWQWAAAAAVLLLVVSGALAYFYRTRPAGETARWVTVKAAPGQVTRVTLPDSSTVWLNAATVLQYPASFSADLREVRLTEGEAFFDVQKNPAKPFVVQAGSVHTQVLGTSFRVKAYWALSEVKVGVATGKVQVRDGRQVLGLLTPNEQLAYEPASGKFRKEIIDAEELTGWQTNRLVFRRASFPEIALALENRFGVKLAYDAARVAPLRLTLQVPKHWNVKEALDMLAALSNTRYTLTNQNAHFYLTP